eukprot:CAMPEP_0117667748 /NCGR_PEP_ID=MMETSP0804-20121206/11149_1 /TAXON_ID=1074897 /ORGANISM="Tetraselmis astigmatica, Strain CCMP880" /LENGTH=552 /DNA_ID=CAMNT_0005475529 /DNA_START=452 /DNA_END=2107 /DNA_ORIENTATION=+
MQRSASRDSSPMLRQSTSLSDEMQRYNDVEKEKPLHSARTRQRNLLFYTAMFLLPACLLHIYTRGLAASVTEGEKGVQYEIVIDAGSSGSRIHVFRFTFGKGTALPTLLFPDMSMKSTPGLSSYTDRPREAGESLLPLLEFAIEQVPRWAQRRTKLTLYATAGLRMLRRSTADAILESCRIALAASPFDFHYDDAALLSGTNEGLYGWVAANFGSGELGRIAQAAAAPIAQHSGLAVVELGGASAQVTFLLEGAVGGGVPATLLNISKGMPALPMFTHSFLGAGQEAAQQRALEMVGSDKWQYEWRQELAVTDPSEEIAVKLDPCYPPGWVQDDGTLGHGNFSKCREVAVALLRTDSCLRLPSTPAQHRCIGGEPVPGWTGPTLAIENFHYTARMLGLREHATLQSFADAGGKYCSTRWELLQTKYPSRTVKELLKYCFSASYIVAFLADGLGVSLSEHRLRFANEVHSAYSDNPVDVDWAMGHVVVSAARRGAGSVVSQPRLAARLELFAASSVAVASGLVLYSGVRRRLKAPAGRLGGSNRGSRTFYDLE